MGENGEVMASRKTYQPWTKDERWFIDRAIGNIRWFKQSIYSQVFYLCHTDLKHRSESSVRNKINEGRGLKCKVYTDVH